MLWVPRLLLFGRTCDIFMIEVMIESIRVSLTNQQRIVILREMDRDRYLPIWIGPFEAESITIGLQHIEISRPQTHDLILNLINDFGFRFGHVEITYMREDVFYADLILINEETEEEKKIDCRPSDALALVARKNIPIFVSDDVFDRAGIAPEVSLSTDNESESEISEADETIEVVEEERLSVFEDFLDNLNIGTDETDEDSPSSEN